MKQILTTIGVVVIMALGFAEFSMSSRVIIYDETEMNTPSLASQWTTAHYKTMESKSSVLGITQYKQLVITTETPIVALGRNMESRIRLYCGNTGLFNRLASMVLGHDRDSGNSVEFFVDGEKRKDDSDYWGGVAGVNSLMEEACA